MYTQVKIIYQKGYKESRNHLEKAQKNQERGIDDAFVFGAYLAGKTKVP